MKKGRSFKSWAACAGLLLGMVLKTNAQAPGWEWGEQIGGGTEIHSVVDSAGNTYLTGNYAGTLTLGTFSLTSTDLNIFVAKRSAAGVYEWVTQGGSTASDRASDIALDPAGNVVIAGNFSTQTASFGPIAVTQPTATVQPIFVAKLNGSGVWQWALAAGGVDSDVAQQIAIDSIGDIYLTGDFRSRQITFGNITLPNTALPYGKREVFVTKITAAGAWSWAVSAGGDDDDRGYGIGVDGAGNVYVSGTVDSTPSRFGLTYFATAGVDGFIAKLSPTGTWLWVMAATGGLDDYCRGLAVTRNGTVYVCGIFVQSGFFGSFRFNPGGNNLFTGCINTLGRWEWVVYSTSSSTALAAADIALTPDESAVRVTGTYGGSTVFGTQTLTSVGAADMAVFSISAAGQWEWAVSAGGTAVEAVTSVGVDAANNTYVSGLSRSSALTLGPVQLNGPTGSPVGLFVAALGNTPVGLPETATSAALTLAPNPAQDVVQLTGGVTTTVPTILLDALGRTVRTYPAGATTFSLRGCAPGLYTVRAGSATRRLVVE